MFEELFDNPRARQKYIEKKIENTFPTWCYLYLANIVSKGRFNVIFTTNFDDLVNEALTTYLGYNAVEDIVSVHDLHATMLYLLGVDHKKLTYKFQGRDFRLTDVSGNVVGKMLS